MQTRSLWFSAERTVEFRTEELRECGLDDVVVESIVSGISHGTELTIFRGQAPYRETALGLRQDPIQPQSTMGGTFEGRFPIKYAYANVGRVLEAGALTSFEPGDLVFCRVPHQSHYVVESELVHKLPGDLDPLDAATTLGLLDVATCALMDHPVLFGDVVSIYGLGVVGQFLVQLARRSASKIIAVDPLAPRRARALEFGADVAVDPSEALAAIKELSDGRGVDVAIEASGVPAALQNAIEGTGAEGTVLMPGYYGIKPAQLTLSPEFHMRRLKMVSSSVNAVDGRLILRWSLPRRMQLNIDLLGPLNAGSLISHRVPFEDAAAAYEMIDQRPEEVMSVVLTYGSVDGA
jgi:threonine dehydrogenase-like Zn-dependent dehydrogenase